MAKCNQLTALPFKGLKSRHTQTDSIWSAYFRQFQSSYDEL